MSISCKSIKQTKWQWSVFASVMCSLILSDIDQFRYWFICNRWNCKFICMDLTTEPQDKTLHPTISSILNLLLLSWLAWLVISTLSYCTWPNRKLTYLSYIKWLKFISIDFINEIILFFFWTIGHYDSTASWSPKSKLMSSFRTLNPVC